MMARIRTIKPDFWRDESLAKISTEACLLAIGLLNHCDDEGFFNANPKLVESDIFPLRELSITTTVLLQELYQIGYVLMFKGSDGKTYGKVSNFEKHQVINKKTPSKIKDLCELMSDYRSSTVSLPTGMEWNGMEKEKEWKKEKKNTVAPPEGVTDSVWQDWISLRKAKRAAVTQTAIDGIEREARKAGVSLQVALETCCARGWTGFKAEWLKDKGEQKSFAEKDYDFKRARWEAMTGRTQGEEMKPFLELEDDTTN